MKRKKFRIIIALLTRRFSDAGRVANTVSARFGNTAVHHWAHDTHIFANNAKSELKI